MKKRHRCPSGHFLPVQSAGYRLREDPMAEKTVTWWIPHVREDTLLRVVPHVPQETEMVLYWVCSICRKAIAGKDAISLGEWRQQQQEQKGQSA